MNPATVPRDDFRHDHGCVGPHPVRADHRSVLEFRRHAEPFLIGLNCALGADDLRPYVNELARVADTHGQRASERRTAERVRRATTIPRHTWPACCGEFAGTVC